MPILSTTQLEALGMKAEWVPALGALNSDGDQAADSELVDRLVDQGSGSKDLISSGANRLRYRAAQLNGHDVVESVRGSRTMISDGWNASTIMNAADWTVLAVAKLSDGVSASGSADLNPHLWALDNAKGGMAVKSTPSVYLWNDDGTVDPTTPIASPDFVLGRWYVFVSVHTGGVIYQSLDLGSQTPATSGSTASLATPFVLFRNHNAAATARYWRGQLARMRVFNQGLTGSTLSAVVADLMAVYALGSGNLALSEMARVIGSSRLNQACVQVLTPSAAVGMLHALDLGPGDDVAISHSAIPGSPVPSSGAAPWQRERCIIERVDYHPGAFEGGGGDWPRLALRQRADHAAHWDVGCTELGSSGERADGVARLGIQQLSLTVGATRYGDNPSDPNQIIAFPPGVEAQALQGHLLERASVGNYQLRSSLIEGLTGFAAKSGSGNRSLDTVNVRFDLDITPNSLNLLADATISTAFKQPWPATTTAFGGSDTVWLSIDVKNVSGHTGYCQVIRASDGKYLKADLTWTATETWLTISTALILLDSASAWQRRAIGPFTPGATTVQLITGVPTTGTGGQSNSYAHVQFEAGAWPSSRMVNDDVMIPRDLSIFSRANAATPVRQFPTASAWTWMFALRHHRSYGDSSTATFPGFRVTYDASNWVRFYFDGATALYKLEIRVAGTTYTASAESKHERGVDEVIAARLTGADGELGLAPYTASVLVDGVKGTDAVASGFPTASGSPALYICNDGSSAAIDAALRHNRLVARALSDDVIARFPS